MRVGTRRSPAVTKATTTPTTERSRVSVQLARPLRRGALTCALWAAACAPATSEPPAVTVTTPTRPLHRGPLSDFVSAVGLRWLVLVRPQQLLSDPELGPAMLQVVPERRFDAFQEA